MQVSATNNNSNNNKNNNELKAAAATAQIAATSMKCGVRRGSRNQAANEHWRRNRRSSGILSNCDSQQTLAVRQKYKYKYKKHAKHKNKAQRT